MRRGATRQTRTASPSRVHSTEELGQQPWEWQGQEELRLYAANVTSWGDQANIFSVYLVKADMVGISAHVLAATKIATAKKQLSRSGRPPEEWRPRMGKGAASRHKWWKLNAPTQPEAEITAEKVALAWLYRLDEDESPDFDYYEELEVGPELFAAGCGPAEVKSLPDPPGEPLPWRLFGPDNLEGQDGRPDSGVGGSMPPTVPVKPPRVKRTGQIPV